MTAALDPVTLTLADMQIHLRTLINPSTIPLGHSLESELRTLRLAHRARDASTRCCSSTTRAANLSSRCRHGLRASVLAALYKIVGQAGTIPKRTRVRASIYSKPRSRTVRPSATDLTILPT